MVFVLHSKLSWSRRFECFQFFFSTCEFFSLYRLLFLPNEKFSKTNINRFCHLVGYWHLAVFIQKWPNNNNKIEKKKSSYCIALYLYLCFDFINGLLILFNLQYFPVILSLSLFIEFEYDKITKPMSFNRCLWFEWQIQAIKHFENCILANVGWMVSIQTVIGNQKLTHVFILQNTKHIHSFSIH